MHGSGATVCDSQVIYWLLAARPQPATSIIFILQAGKLVAQVILERVVHGDAVLVDPLALNLLEHPGRQGAVPGNVGAVRGKLHAPRKRGEWVIRGARLPAHGRVRWVVSGAEMHAPNGGQRDNPTSVRPRRIDGREKPDNHMVCLAIGGELADTLCTFGEAPHVRLHRLRPIAIMLANADNVVLNWLLTLVGAAVAMFLLFDRLHWLGAWL